MSKYKGKHGGKKGQKIRAWVDPPPYIRAMPERKRFFLIDVFPKLNLFLPKNYFISMVGCKKEGKNIARMFVFRSPSAPPSIHLASRESEICLKTRSGKKMKTRSPWPIFLNSFYFIQA